jgi:hypothetical protein
MGVTEQIPGSARHPPPNPRMTQGRVLQTRGFHWWGGVDPTQ